MPRTSDHDARRAQIRAAIRDVALESGLPAVTVARVAAAAKISVGLVQHYFPTKEAMLVDAFVEVRREVEERIDAARVKAERKHHRIEQILTVGLSELLPLDARRRRESYLVLAYSGLALHQDEMRTAERQSDAHLRARLSEAVTNGKECGEVAEDVDADQVAWELLASVHGLAHQLYREDSPTARRRTRTAVAAEVGAVFNGPCNRALSEPSARRGPRQPRQRS